MYEIDIKNHPEILECINDDFYIPDEEDKKNLEDEDGTV